MDLDLRLVRYAVALADELHFGRAATRLRIAQQTLSAQISQLETRLGVSLFSRDSRQVELTPAGELVVTRGRELLALAQELLDELRDNTPPLRLDVITEGLTAGVIAREMAARMNSQPVEVRQGQGLAATLSAVTEGRVDFAFGWTDGLEHPLAPGIHHQLVRWEPVGVVVPADHPLASLEQVATCDLAGYPLIMHTAEEAVDWQSWVEAAVDAFGLHIGWRLHGHGRGAANAAVLTLEAPAFAPVEAPVPPGVVYRPLVDPIPVCPIEVVWRSRETPPARIRQALGVIRDIVQEHRWLNLPESEYWLPPAHGRQAKS